MIVIDGQSFAAGGSEIVLNNTPLSVGSGGLIVGGSGTIAIPAISRLNALFDVTAAAGARPSSAVIVTIGS